MIIQLTNGKIINPKYIVSAYKEQIYGGNGFYNIKIYTINNVMDIRYELSSKEIFEKDFEEIKNKLNQCL
ncbi:TPA: hypothetical protein ACXDAZ_002525 [Clostridium botulinum]